MSKVFRLLASVALLTYATSALSQAQAPITPFKAGDRYFFVASNGALYVKDDLNAKPRQILAPNTFTVVVPSQNGEYIAYGVTGTEIPPRKETGSAPAGSYEVRVREVGGKGREIDTLHNARISRASWTRNNKGFFYVREDTTDGRERIYYHTAGQAQSNDLVIFSRHDQPDWSYDVRVSDDGHYAVITIFHSVDDNTRLYFIDLDNPKKPSLNAPIVKLVDQFSSRYTFVDNGGYHFFLQTTRDAPNGHIVLANTNIIRETRWQSVVPQSVDTLLFARTAGDEYVIVVGRNNGKVTARIYSPPNPREVQEAMRRRADSIRKAGGRDPQADARRAQDRSGRRSMPPGGADVPILRLNLTRELPIPEGGTLIDITSHAEDDELFYTVRFADGTTRAYLYDIKTRRTGVFDTNVDGR
jgi:hypothetical protein